MSSITYTRDEMYQKWKIENPKLAKKFLIPDMNPVMYGLSAMALLIGTVVTLSIAQIGINYLSITNAVLLVGVVVSGSGGLAGLIYCTIVQCKKNYLSTLPLTASHVNKIAGEILIDTRPENTTDRSIIYGQTFHSLLLASSIHD